MSPPMSGNGSVQSGIPPFSISFSGSGFLAVYQLGAAQCLFDLAPGVIHAAPKVFGASAGSLAAAAVVCGANMECMRDEMLATARASRKHLLGPLHPSFNVFKLLECCLHRSLPDNAHELATGRLYISMTRLMDGENILMSDFMSKEELVQALLCSCFVPFYCGLKPPSFRGEHYIDGGFTNIQPIQDSSLTLTVSPFAGEVDICPCDQPPSFYHVHVNSFNFQFTLQNFFRMMDALFPPTSVALKRAYYHGYQDAVFFLQANDLMGNRLPQASGSLSLDGLCSGSVRDHLGGLEETEQEEAGTPPCLEGSSDTQEYRDALEDWSWNLSSMEQAVYCSLPAWLQGALLCNLRGFQNSSVSARLISYLLLPYTLPAVMFFFFSHRLLIKLKDLPEEAFWLWEDMKQIAYFLKNILVRSLQKNLADRFTAGSDFSSGVDLLTKPERKRIPPDLHQQSALHLRLSTSSSSFMDNTDEQSDVYHDSLEFTFLLNLQLALEGQPSQGALKESKDNLPLEFEASLEEVPSSSSICCEKDQVNPSQEPGVEVNGLLPPLHLTCSS
ncbi:1-acylglycerol-3-phosphate O-acyltransferase Pnpla3-like [Lepisosteus oculatus]|uniref:1-acylglycerol-3-phosphate O-acyltransferase Pnpla3-like n=1 Tax=Lepisosteus oculatus TaxID=7918 RepID=UPI0037248207